MAQAPAIEQVITALAAALEALAPSLQKQHKFKRTSEGLTITDAPVKACTRLFDVDFLGGQDDSAEGRGIQNAGAADRRARFRVRIAYSKAQQERALETVMASDSELVMRAMRGASWAGTPVQRVVARSTVDRSNTAKLFLDLALEVQYRDVEG